MNGDYLNEQSREELRAQLAGIRQRRQRVKELRRQQDLLSLSLEIEKNSALMDQEHAMLDLRSTLASNVSDERLLDMFEHWNALNECFYISHSGPFGTINGLRLGLEAPPFAQSDGEPVVSPTSNAPEIRRIFSFTTPTRAPTGPPPIRVPWTEINAALGQVALLLSTLEKFQYAGISYRHQIINQGSTTKIGIRRGAAAAVSQYNLHHDDSFQLFGRRNFNIAIECLCECVLDAAEAVKDRDPTMTLPYAIERSKGELTIGRLPVCIPFGQDGTGWTRAMQYLLTDIKHIMAFRLFLSSSGS